MRLSIMVLVCFLSACASVREPTNECRISLLDGQARYGTFTQFAKGDTITVRAITEGVGCPGIKIILVAPKIGATVKYTPSMDERE